MTASCHFCRPVSCLLEPWAKYSSISLSALRKFYYVSVVTIVDVSLLFVYMIFMKSAWFLSRSSSSVIYDGFFGCSDGRMIGCYSAATVAASSLATLLSLFVY